MSAPDGLMKQCNAHKKVEEHKAAKGKTEFDDMTGHRIKLQQTANRPACRPRGTHHFRADQDRHRNKGGKPHQIDFILLAHV